MGGLSAEAAVCAGIVEALRGDAVLGETLNGVFEGPSARASAPWAEIGDALASDWGTKDWRGREVRVAVMLRDLAERPARLGMLVEAAGAAIAAMPAALDGWRVASAGLLRSRVAGEGPGRWLAVVEYRVRVLAEE